MESDAESLAIIVELENQKNTGATVDWLSSGVGAGRMVLEYTLRFVGFHKTSLDEGPWGYFNSSPL
ncbi:hypothetical protein E2C01_009209 [Portunus trituberculatus]|uniref:Uncharacterized protein n=1 Tax=Portunus trituberculatus TaxID=210409 RepID=A0A5B7D4S8_PORTR|nr:hypothetical protein [Portunus trituberculatus]